MFPFLFFVLVILFDIYTYILFLLITGFEGCCYYWVVVGYCCWLLVIVVCVLVRVANGKGGKQNTCSECG